MRPKNKCQFQSIAQLVIVAESFRSLKKIKGGSKQKRKTKRKKGNKRKTKRKLWGGKPSDTDDDIVNHLLQLFSTIDSFDNQHGTCAINTLAVIRGIDSNDFENLQYAYSAFISSDEIGLGNKEMASVLLANEVVSIESHFKKISFNYEVEPMRYFASLHKILKNIALTQKKSSFLTYLSYPSKYYTNEYHAVALWYTETNQVILIDIQLSVKQNKLILYCENTLQNLPNKIVEHRDNFDLRPLYKYIVENINCGPNAESLVFHDAIVSVDFLANKLDVIGEHMNKMITDVNNLDNTSAPAPAPASANDFEFDFASVLASDPNFASALPSKKDKLQTTKVINYYLGDLRNLYNKEASLISSIRSLLMKYEDVDSNAARALSRFSLLYLNQIKTSRENNDDLESVKDEIYEIAKNLENIDLVDHETLLENLQDVFVLNDEIYNFEKEINKLKEDTQSIFGDNPLDSALKRAAKRKRDGKN